MSVKPLWLIWLPLALILQPIGAWARPDSGPRSADGSPFQAGAPDTSHATVSFASLTGRSTPITLRDQASSSDLAISVPASETIKRASLHLLGASSASLLPRQSQLLVSLNGEPIAQISLGGKSSKIDQTIQIPPALFKAGENRLDFSATERSQEGCEAFNAPQLWTEISQRSRLSLVYADHQPPLSFAGLKAALGQENLPTDAGSGGTVDTAPNVMILYDGGLVKHPDAIMAVAQSLALLYGHDPVRVLARPLDPANLKEAQVFVGNVVLLKLASAGTGGALGAAGPRTREAILTLTRNAKGSAVLIIAAADPAILAHAARLFGSSGFAWPDQVQAAVSVPAGATIDRPAAAAGATSDSMTFQEAGFPITTEYGRKQTFGPVNFWNSRWDSHAVLYAHLAYSAGAAAGSQILVFVNGNMVGTIPLTSPVGGNYPDYKLLVPSDAMKVGENRLTLEPIFQVAAAPTVACAPHDDWHGLAVTMFSDSRIAIIGGSQVPPNNLKAISAGIYPINTIAITTPTAPVISAAATFGAKLAQVDHRSGVQMVDARPRQAEAGTLVIGPAQTLPSRLVRSARLIAAHSATAIIEQPGTSLAQALPAELRPAADWVSAVTGRLAAPTAGSGASQPGGTDPAIGDFAGAVILAVAEPVNAASPGNAAPTVVVTAENGATLQRGVATLVDRRLWTRLAGSAAVMEPGADQLQTVSASAQPFDTEAALGYFASNHPALAIFVTCVLLIVVAVLIRALVAARRRWLYPSVRSVDQR